MVAEMAPQPARLPLLLLPDPPLKQGYRSFGWRWQTGSKFTVLERREQDDERGAVVQWMVLRYYRDGVLRKELAAELGYSERHVQELLTGKTRPGSYSQWYLAYAVPVIRALDRLGFPVRERAGIHKSVAARLAAMRATLLNAADVIEDDGQVVARRILADIALLTVECPS